MARSNAQQRGEQAAQPADEKTDGARSEEARDPTLRDLVPIEEVPVDTWIDVFERIGYPSPLSRTTVSHETLENAVDEGRLSRELTELLQILHELGTSPGVDLLYRHAADAGIDTDRWPIGLGPRELVAHVWLHARDSRKLAEAIQLTRMTFFERSAPEVFRDFVGKVPRPCSVTRATMARLERLLQPIFLRHDFGPDVTVSPREDEGYVSFRVLRGGRIQAPLVFEAKARRTLPFRPVQCDVIRYEPSTGRLSMPPLAALQVKDYPDAFGEALFDDPKFFAKKASCTLKPLQVRREEALYSERYDGIIDRSTLVECLWRRPDGSKVRLSGRDCFTQIEELSLPISQGTLLEAKLQVHLQGKRSSRVVVVVQDGAGAHHRNPAHRDLIDRYLEDIGIKFPKPTETASDAWNLAGVSYPESWWRQMFGKTLDALKTLGLLIPKRPHALTHPDHPESLGVLEVRQELVDGEPRFVGVSRDPAVPSRFLSSEELKGLAFDPAQLAQAVAKALVLPDTIEWTPMQGCADLGVLDLVGAQTRVFLTTCAPTWSAAHVDWLVQKQCAPGERPVFILPSGRTIETGHPQVRFDPLRPPYCDLLPDIVDALRLGDSAPAIARARREHVLVVDVVRRAVWVSRGEVPLQDPASRFVHVPLSDQGFRFVECVARAKRNRRPVTTSELAQAVAPRGTVVDDSTARHAKIAVKKALQKALGAAYTEDPFPSLGRGNAYDLCVPFLMPEPRPGAVKRS